MELERNGTSKKQIRTLLGVFGSALLSAFLITAFFVYFYSPSGTYRIQNALIDPQLVDKLAFNDNNPKTGAQDRYVYDGITFSYYDGKKSQSIPVSPGKYQKFYKVIQHDVSLQEVPNEIQMSFNQENIAKLIVQVRTESHAAWQDNTKPFQQVHFLPNGDYYRVELRESNPTNKWVYFQHSHITQNVMDIFK